MLVFNKGNHSLIIGLLCFFCALFLGFLNVANAKTSDDSRDSSQSDSTIVKIPPPIEGLAPNAHKPSKTLDRAEISILSSDNTRHSFTVELARTTREQQAGMMFRRHIPRNTGMLFLFKDERERNFWMKNTSVSLDILFIRKDGVIHHIHPNAEINTLTRISSGGAVSAVLEIGAGEAEALGLHVGDRILYEVFTSANLE